MATIGAHAEFLFSDHVAEANRKVSGHQSGCLRLFLSGCVQRQRILLVDYLQGSSMTWTASHQTASPLASYQLSPTVVWMHQSAFQSRLGLRTAV